ncbi:unnamed protein product [Brachionus calyciflorus]|uniref:Hsp90 chaperone protein kinase-targeting subunit n=1 Tax=Brachionus calyciflorus TaxID=104777 RepID=A0A813QUV0_9BILA|nr:unnamed protein product [Brachionus calyciflorus]
MPIDYSKWKNIEISDDEDDTHPNIDTPSLFRWRHQARVERQAEAEREKSEFEKNKREAEMKKQELKQKLKEAEAKGSEELNRLKLEEEELRRQEDEFRKKEEELKKKEKLTPWNVDTISHDKFAKTIINKEETKQNDENLTEEERAEKYKKFLDKNKSKIKHFGMLKHYEDSKRYLTENLDLVCDDTANYLVVWCIDLEIEEKHDLMEHVAHQCIVMQFILELSKTLKCDPRACVAPFFVKMQQANREYKDGFYDELNAFKGRIKKRANEKIEAAMAEAEEEERQKRLGPGGLDPVEVFETLPEVLQKCFESQDIQLLQNALLSMSKEDAEYHMDRCIKSGLWVPDAKKDQAKKEGDDTKTENQNEQDELYDTPDS